MKSDCRTREQMNKEMAFLCEKIAKLEKSEKEHRRIVVKLKKLLVGNWWFLVKARIKNKTGEIISWWKIN